MMNSSYWWTIGQIKVADCQNSYPLVKCRKRWNGREINTIASDGMPVDEGNLLSPCKITLMILNEALKYAQYLFQKKLWNKNETLEYVRRCCFTKNVTSNAMEVFWQGHGHHGPKIWQKYYGIDILDFSDAPLHLWLGPKKYIISTILWFLRFMLVQSQDFGR